VAGILYYGGRLTSSDGVNEGWQVGSGKTYYFRGGVSDFNNLILTGMREHGEVTGSKVQGDGYSRFLSSQGKISECCTTIQYYGFYFLTMEILMHMECPFKQKSNRCTKSHLAAESIHIVLLMH